MQHCSMDVCKLWCCLPFAGDLSTTGTPCGAYCMLHTAVQPADVMVSGFVQLNCDYYLSGVTTYKMKNREYLVMNAGMCSVVAAMATLPCTALLCLHVRFVVSCSHCLQHTTCYDTSNNSIPATAI
jgi:hypothetical protein